MRVTARGAGLAAGAAVLLGTGLAFGYPHLVVLGTACLAALLFAGGYVWWRPRLTVAREVEPDRVMRGESSTVTLHVGNTSRLRGATLIAHDRCGSAAVPVPLLRLKAGGTTTASYPVPTARRGVVAIGPLRVVRRDPLGLLALSRGYGGTSTVWVYPRVHRLTAVPTGVARSLDGRVDRVPHGSITFDTLREYVVGDELRHVHWRTTARIGELMVREHLDTSLPRLVVLLDDRRGAYPDVDRAGESARFEAACEAAASIVMAAFREELPVALRLVGGAHAGGKGSRSFLDVLAEASLHDPPSADPGARGRAAHDPEPHEPHEARSRATDGPGPHEARNRDTHGPGPHDAARGTVTGLDATVAELRTRKAGDTLIYLTGSSTDLGRVATLRGAYAAVVAGVFGDGDAPGPERITVLAARDGADFAAAWDGVRSW
ncbi:DUF58 domain-containing protein [Dactylosporangium sucinum]|uniref:DUF58 domain-containing protein n=1 Tax=Dactylosporangium sucinum TaxID=1424081 RepID=A0A917TAW0_9ACTN|nr:DUF58 domain-containing protein [Dactylosporangium sucinum]GGM13909.1 hypothetical protein GCM10007977_013700 [Dactylosporangium sucinum]